MMAALRAFVRARPDLFSAVVTGFAGASVDSTRPTRICLSVGDAPAPSARPSAGEADVGDICSIDGCPFPSQAGSGRCILHSAGQGVSDAPIQNAPVTAASVAARRARLAEMGISAPPPAGDGVRGMLPSVTGSGSGVGDGGAGIVLPGFGGVGTGAAAASGVLPRTTSGSHAAAAAAAAASLTGMRNASAGATGTAVTSSAGGGAGSGSAGGGDAGSGSGADAVAAAGAVAAAAGAGLRRARGTAATVHNEFFNRFPPRPSICRFKCMNNGGCNKGKSWDRKLNGEWHDQGTQRVAFRNLFRREHDGFCPFHFSAAPIQHQAMELGFEKYEARRQGRAEEASGGQKGKGKKRKAATTPAPAAGAAGDGRHVKRRGKMTATPASIAKQKAILKAAYPGQTDITDDSDISPRLQQRQQRHEVMDRDEVNSTVFDVVMRHLKGMPCPQENGSMSGAKAPWTNQDSNCLPLLDLGCPMNRAERHRPKVGEWTERAKKKVLDEFLVFGKIVVFVPEVVCRRVLCRDKRFCTEFRGVDGVKIGVKLPCPTCLSNKHTQFRDGWNKRLRVVHTARGANLWVAARRYSCFNPDCTAVRGAVKKKMEKGGVQLPLSGTEKRPVTAQERARMAAGDLSGISPNVIETLLHEGASFSIYDERYMALYPPAVRLRFPFDLYAQGGATHGLLDKTMIVGQSVSSMTQELQQLYAEEQRNVMLKYAAFTQAEGAGLWPCWIPPAVGSWMSPPSGFNIEKYSEARYQKVKPYLEAEMCSRPVEMLSWDGTFASAKMVNSEAKVLTFLLNETGHVVSYAAVPSEAWMYILPMFMALRNRLEAQGTLNKLTLTASDTCCEGLKDPTKHVVCKIFDGVAEGPKADAFHKTKLVTDSMYPGQPYYAQACREVGAVIARRSQRDQLRCAYSLVESGVEAKEAMEKALGSYGSKHTRTFTPSTIDADLGKWYDKFKKLNDQEVRKGHRQKPQPLFRERSGAQPSTGEAVDNVRKCATKGCFNTGLSLKDAYITDNVGAQTGVPTYHKKLNTSSNENFHGKLNQQVVSQAPRVGPERGDRELAYMVKFHNDRQDARRGLRKPDFLWGRTWDELEAERLWTNIEGPHPGGNQQMPLPGTVERFAKENTVGKEFFGHEYLANLHEQMMKECAHKVGLNINSDLLQHKSFVAKPAEETLPPEYDDHNVYGLPSPSARRQPQTLSSVGTPFIPSASPADSNDLPPSPAAPAPAPAPAAPAAPVAAAAAAATATPGAAPSPSPSSTDGRGGRGLGGGQQSGRGRGSGGGGGAGSAGPDRRRIVLKPTDIVAKPVTPTTPDEISLLDRCWAKARAQTLSEKEVYRVAAYHYNLEVCQNTRNANESSSDKPVLNLLGSVTEAGVRQYWQSRSKYASVSIAGAGAGAGGGGAVGDVFFMTEQDIGKLSGKRPLQNLLRSLEGIRFSNSLKEPALKDMLRQAVRDKVRVKPSPVTPVADGPVSDGERRVIGQK